MRAAALLMTSFLAAESLTVLLLPGLLPAGAAWAQDDDDGGGGDDDDGGGSRGGDDDDNGGRRGDDDDDDAPVRRRPPREAAPAVPPPVWRNEIVVMGLAPADLDPLLAQGFTVTESLALPGIATTVTRLAPPAGQTLEAARAVVRGLPSGGNADFNHYYRANQSNAVCEGPHCRAFGQVDWLPVAAAVEACRADLRIGMIDTGINAEHLGFEGAEIVLHRLHPAETEPSGATHGTSVASLLAGNAESRTPGLVPDLPLVAVDAFHVAGGDERADAFTLIRALAILSEEGVRVANLSFAGPENTALSDSLTLLAQEMVIVAAAGNEGPAAPPVWPAAHEGVIAVTAVDAEGRVYRRAGQGDHIDLAAPGVEVWTAASISGGRAKSGTSFAAPFVTAAAARLLQLDPDLPLADVAKVLADTAQDLGAPGRDPVFGDGLVRMPAGTC